MIKVYLKTHNESFKRRLSARLYLAQTIEEADVILFFEDAINELEDMLFIEKPLIFLHQQAENVVNTALNLGVHEKYLIDATNLRISNLKKIIEEAKEEGLIIDPFVLGKTDDLLLQDIKNHSMTSPQITKQPSYNEVVAEIKPIQVEKMTGHVDAGENMPLVLQSESLMEKLAKRKESKIIFYGLTGGSGTTTLAIGLYQALVENHNAVSIFTTKDDPLYTIYPNIVVSSDLDQLNEKDLLIIDDSHGALDIEQAFQIGPLLFVMKPRYIDLHTYEYRVEPILNNEQKEGLIIINGTDDSLETIGAIRYLSTSTPFDVLNIPDNKEAVDHMFKLREPVHTHDVFKETIETILENLR